MLTAGVTAATAPGYRRTLVGLKRGPRAGQRWTRDELQTDPRGVEALSFAQSSNVYGSLQTDPRGVEATNFPACRYVCAHGSLGG